MSSSDKYRWDLIIYEATKRDGLLNDLRKASMQHYPTWEIKRRKTSIDAINLKLNLVLEDDGNRDYETVRFFCKFPFLYTGHIFIVLTKLFMNLHIKYIYSLILSLHYISWKQKFFLSFCFVWYEILLDNCFVVNDRGDYKAWTVEGMH